MAVERATLGDLREIAKLSPGIRVGGWEPGEPNRPLLEPLKIMADVIVTWFNSEQRWKLAGVNSGLINLKRMEESSADSGDLDHPKRGPDLRAKREESDKFTPVFHFVAERPPMRARGLIGRQKVLDFPNVFAPDFRDKVRIWDRGIADILVDHIGPVHRLDKALEELSSPYYLVGATVFENSRRHVPTTVFELKQQKEADIKPELPKELTVMVYMRDLMDEVRLVTNRVRRV